MGGIVLSVRVGGPTREQYSQDYGQTFHSHLAIIYTEGGVGEGEVSAHVSSSSPVPHLFLHTLYTSQCLFMV